MGILRVPENLLYGLIGLFFGWLLTLAREMFAEKRALKREAEYLAIRVVCALDSFLENCASVVLDNGVPDEDGYYRIRVTAEAPQIEFSDVNWKALPADLMYTILSFPNLIAEINNYVASSFDHASPPEFEESFELRQREYAQLGLKVSALSDELRVRFRIPHREMSNWDIVGYLRERNDKLSQLQADREKNAIVITT